MSELDDADWLALGFFNKSPVLTDGYGLKVKHRRTRTNKHGSHSKHCINRGVMIDH